MGGACFHAKFLADELAERGHEVHVLYSVDAYKVKRGNRADRPENGNVFTHPIETRFGLSPYVTFLLGKSNLITRRFRNLVRETRPDVVHHHNVSLLGYNILKKMGNYLNLYTAHDYWLICPQSTLLRKGGQVCQTASCKFCGLYSKRPPQLWRYRNAFRNAVMELDVIIAPSTYVKNRIGQKFGVKSVVIPNFVPEPPISIEPSGYTDFFLFAGRLESYKGLIPVISIFEKAGERLHSKLVIAGTGSQANSIQDMIRNRGLSDRIILIGWVGRDAIYRLLKDANAMIIPSIALENCPLIALESLSVGTPIIAANRGGLPEIVEKVDNALVFDSYDGLRRILTDFNRAGFPAETAKDVYLKYYSPATFMAKYTDLINQCSLPVANDVAHPISIG